MKQAVEKILIPQPGVLVLSDLQFGSTKPSFGIELDRAADAAKAVLQAVSPFRDKIHLLILPGDLTSKAEEEEFLALDLYLDTLLDVGDPNSLKPIGVVICPGNHDLSKSTRADRIARFNNYLSFKRGFYTRYWKRFGSRRIMRAPWMNIDGSTATIPTAMPAATDPNEIWTVYDFRDLLYNYVVSFNSAADIEETDKGDWEPKYQFGYVHPKRQLAPVHEYLSSQETALRGYSGLAVLHHNIAHARPVNEKAVTAPGQMGIVRNYNEVSEALQDLGISLVIHGHQHEVQVTTQKRHGSPRWHSRREKENVVDPGVTIFGAGSAGCKPGELIEGAINHFHFIQLDPGDPILGRKINYTTFGLVSPSGDGGSSWRVSHINDVVLPLQHLRPSFNHTFSLIEQSNIATAPTREQALERLAAFLKSRVGYPVVGANLIRSSDFRLIESTRLASTFAPIDCHLLDTLYYCVPSPTVFPHHSLTIEIATIRRPTSLEYAREHLGPRSYLRYLQSQLMNYSNLSVVTYWFEEAAGSWIGFRVYTTHRTRQESFNTKLDAQAFRKLITAVLVYWALRDEDAIYQGPVGTGLAASDGSPVPRDPGATEQLTAARRAAIEELFAESIPDYWDRDAFEQLEAKIYASKRDIEKLIVYSLIHSEVERGHKRGSRVPSLTRRVARRLDGLRRRVAWAGQDLGKAVDPLLVAFWVPFAGEGSIHNAWQEADLHYLLTWDQIAACAFEDDAELRATSMKNLREMLSIKMRRYGDLVFDGISAYVRTSEAQYTSLDAYEEPLVAFERFDAGLEIDLPEEAAGLIAEFKDRSDQRRKLTNLEKRFWQQREAVGVFVAPIWGRQGVEAVLQIQTSDLEIIKILQAVDFLSALDSINLGIAPT